MNNISPDELKRLYPHASPSTLARNQAHCVLPNAVHKPRLRDESLAVDAREDISPKRCLVRITSYRVCLCDERNLFDKHLTDALVTSGIIFDDSPEYCEVQVNQVQVERWEQERTEIVIDSQPLSVPT